LSDGKVYTLELLYKGSTRRLRGFLTGAGEGGRKDSEMSLFDVVIPVGGGGDWYVGVTGSCGGLWQRVSLTFSPWIVLMSIIARDLEVELG
jgi:peptide-N4-(N-acetyl-beta-glucosaminyl)asparagine amidase